VLGWRQLAVGVVPGWRQLVVGVVLGLKRLVEGGRAPMDRQAGAAAWRTQLVGEQGSSLGEGEARTEC
jgi:hypothetical protein